MMLLLYWYADMLTEFHCCATGLIAAACGNLATVLQSNGHVSKSLSNGHLPAKVHQNGHVFKSSNGSNGSINGLYINGNGNGVHW